jgi:hypothetical protein
LSAKLWYESESVPVVYIHKRFAGQKPVDRQAEKVQANKDRYKMQSEFDELGRSNIAYFAQAIFSVSNV